MKKMIIKDPYTEKHTPKMRKEIEVLLHKTIPEKVVDRKYGFGENWSDEREKELQNWLDEISNQYEFDFRLVYASTDSLFPGDYKKFIIYS